MGRHPITEYKAAVLLLAALSLQAATIRIGVLDLFHPKTLHLRAATIAIGAERIALQSDAELTATSSTVVCRIGGRELHGARLLADGPIVRLSVPGKLDRSYRGSLEVTASAGILQSVITMDLEDAVASSVAAEMPDAPPEALKAQAIAARSYFRAAVRHQTGFDFCDTTHCQWVQGIRPPTDPAVRAANTTAALVLGYNGSVLAAMYFRSCAGKTLRAVDVKLDPSLYPYFAVTCEACSRQPDTWESRIPAAAAAVILRQGPSEALRLQLVRSFGWDRLPSNTYVTGTAGDDIVFHGKGSGHGVGLCQRGAIAMARSGASAPTILLHYYPNTSLRR